MRARPGFAPSILHEIQVNGRAPLALSGRITGAVIGTALESWRAGEGTILVLANLGWFSPTKEVEREVARLRAALERLERRVEELARR